MCESVCVRERELSREYKYEMSVWALVALYNRLHRLSTTSKAASEERKQREGETGRARRERQEGGDAERYGERQEE